MPTSWPQPAVLQNLLPSTTEGKEQSTTSSVSFDHRVLALYKFVSPKIPKDSLPDLKKELETVCRQYSARGTLLIAEEGINGTICYPYSQQDENGNEDSSSDKNKQSSDELLSFLQGKFDNSLRIRVSAADKPVFARLKIKIKSEIVTMHWWGDKNCSNATNNENKDSIGECDQSTPATSCGPCCPTERVGKYVKPNAWNELLEDPDTLVIDTRNEYEIDVGTFRNAINPHTQSFVEFPDWIQKNLVDKKSNENNIKATQTNPFQDKKKIAMFCTGGIRCEKATNAAMQLIPKDIPVYHLEGGILAYLDEVSEKESMFDGDCYVFDQRVAVTYKNKPSTTFRQKCHACRHPLSNQDLERQDYKHGVHCRYCIGTLTDKQEERFAQRQKQIQLALEKGQKHIHDPKEVAMENKKKKVCTR